MAPVVYTPPTDPARLPDHETLSLTLINVMSRWAGPGLGSGFVWIGH